MNWTLFHKFSSPQWFFRTTILWLPYLKIIASAVLCSGLIWGLAFAPPDYLQGDSYRIIYVHVPAAFLAQFIYIMMAIAGFTLFIWRIKLADMLIVACAPIGASFTLLALATGAIWGMPTWGTWWVWDARLTSMLILLFLYIGVIALRGALTSKSAEKACALLVIVGVVNIPIIKFSVQWWDTLHQGVTLTLTQKPLIAPQMLWPLLLCISGFYLFFITILISRLHNEILFREKQTHWVRKLLQ